MSYAIIVERSPSGYSAFVPDLPGCVAAAAGLREDGLPVPPATTEVSIVHVS